MGLLDWFTNPIQPGGLLGGGPSSEMPMTNLGIIGAMLQDIGASYDKRQGTALPALAMQMQRLGEQKKYQDTLGQMFGVGQPTATLPQITFGTPSNDKPTYGGGMNPDGSMSLSGNNRPPLTGLTPQIVNTGSTGMTDVGPLANLPNADALRAIAMGLGPQAGMSFLGGMLGNAQDRQGRLDQFAMDRQAKQADAALEPPKTRQIEDGANILNQHWDKKTLQWVTDSKAPRWQPQQPSNGPAAPSGYRYKPDGSLESIPGGPADPNVAGRGTGKPTEDQAKNTQLYERSRQQLKILVGDGGKEKGTFDELARTGNQVGSLVPGTTWFTSEGYQRADGALKDIAASYLYSVSGATANPGEVQNLADTVRPKPGDSAATIADKKARVTQMVESIKMRATPQLLNQPQQQPNSNGGWSIQRVP